MKTVIKGKVTTFFPVYIIKVFPTPAVNCQMLKQWHKMTGGKKCKEMKDKPLTELKWSPTWLDEKH